MTFHTRSIGQQDTTSFRLYLEKKGEGSSLLSFFHDVPTYPSAASLPQTDNAASSLSSDAIVNMIVEIPKNTRAKMEIATSEPMNPIKQDMKKGQLRFVHDIAPHKGYPWNYGAIPQTWEDPNHICPHTQLKGDRDPLDILEISDDVYPMGSVVPVKVLGALALKDEGETDWKIISIHVAHPNASKLNDIDDVERVYPGLLDATRRWFRIYKVPDGKPENEFGLDGAYQNKSFALEVIRGMRESWVQLMTGQAKSSGEGFSISTSHREPLPTAVAKSDTGLIRDELDPIIQNILQQK